MATIFPGTDSEGTAFFINEDLVPCTVPKAPSTTSVNFSGHLDPPLRLQDDPTECGGQLWPGGMVLAKYLLRCKMAELKGKTIVELGAGSGLVGLAIALKQGSGPGSIHLTDLPHILPLLQHNISLNAPAAQVQATVLEWGAQPPENVPSFPDVILAADCVYFEPAFPLLLETLQTLMGNGTIGYFCFKKRRRADLKFVKLARKVFEFKEVEDDPDKEVWEREKVHL